MIRISSTDRIIGQQGVIRFQSVRGSLRNIRNQGMIRISSMHRIIGQQGVIRFQSVRGSLRNIRNESMIRIISVYRIISQQGVIRFQSVRGSLRNIRNQSVIRLVRMTGFRGVIGADGVKRLGVVKYDFDLDRVAGGDILLAVQFHSNRIDRVGEKGDPLVRTGNVNPERSIGGNINGQVLSHSLTRNGNGKIRDRGDCRSSVPSDR